MKRILIILLLLATKTPAQPPIDFNQICVDSVYYDPVNPDLIHITIYNGSSNSINYPVVQIIESDGDTISNLSQALSFFAHPVGYTQTYTDSITVSGIVDFSNYTFVFYENIWDTSAVIGFCNVTSINENSDEQISIYPNPCKDVLQINYKGNKNSHLCIYAISGEVVLNIMGTDFLNGINIAYLSKGVYILKIIDEEVIFVKRFAKD